MKIVADKDIPLISYFFKDAVLKPGREISKKDLKEADILLVRSLTKVNQDLLQGTTVKFVGSTTSGIDHMDTDWLEKARIQYANAQGCNAHAVSEYVISIIAALQHSNKLGKSNLTAAVIGVGAIGRLVAENLKTLGFEVWLSDPPRARVEKNFSGITLNDIHNVDVISLHTPLYFNGPDATFHLIDKNFLKRQKENTVLINTSRGEVVSSNDLKKFGRHLQWCLDVFENEPHIDLDILHASTIATPHIAGHSIQAKLRGIEWIYKILLDKGLIDSIVQLPGYPRIEISAKGLQTWQELILSIYNPLETSDYFKRAIPHKTFDEVRNHFQARSEWAYVDVEYF